MSSINISSKGLYFDYDTNVEFSTKHGKLTAKDIKNIDWEINSNDSPTPATCSITLHNFSDDFINKIAKKDHVIIKTGAKDIYGIGAEGNITSIQKDYSDGHDRKVTIYFVESTSLVNKKINEKASGVSVKKTKKSKKVSLSFKKNTKAKQIIEKIAKVSNIKIYHFKLAKNKNYKRGYTVNNHPYNAITKIVNDCNSVVYQRIGHLIIDDLKTDNPFKEHLYLSLGSGLLHEPSFNDDNNNNKTYTLECWDDIRLNAGSTVYVKSTILDNTYRVKSVKHSHENNYRMEVVIYA